MYKVYIVEPSSGKTLNLDGYLWRKDEKLQYNSCFDSHEGALTQKDELLELHEWAICTIYDEATKEDRKYSNEDVVKEYLKEYLKENTSYKKYLGLPWYKKLFVSAPEMKHAKKTIDTRIREWKEKMKKDPD